MRTASAGLSLRSPLLFGAALGFALSFGCGGSELDLIQYGEEGTVDYPAEGEFETEPVEEDLELAMLHQGLVVCNARPATGYQSGTPKSIIVVDADGKPSEIATANAYAVMQQAAAQGGVQLRVVSGFRTQAEQQHLYACYKNCSCNGCNLAAKPGYSNHQSGLALDLNTRDPGVYNWLAAHGGKYGFVRTVPSEPWHWEFRGTAPAGGPCGPNGSAELTDGRVFNAQFYLDIHPDLQNAFGPTNTSAARSHWLSNGLKEGRMGSPALDVKYYLSIHPDLQNAFGGSYEAALKHFVKNGIAEGRVGSSLLDVKFYLATHKDLKNAFGATNYPAGVNHFLGNGIAEGRMGSPAFHGKYYLGLYGDLRSAFGATNYTAAQRHFLRNGMAEGRRGSLYLHTIDYLNRYSHLKNAFGTNRKAALRHYLVHGIKEGRRGSPDFDAAFYMANHADLRNAFGATNYRAGLIHWYTNGRGEGRQAVP